MKGMSLSSMVQVINLDRRSCDIEAQSAGKTGQLHFREGRLVDALADGLQGEAAACAIFGWGDAEFHLSEQNAPRERRIEADVTHLLLEAARRQDEAKAGRAVGVPPSGGSAPSSSESVAKATPAALHAVSNASGDEWSAATPAAPTAVASAAPAAAPRTAPAATAATAPPAAPTSAEAPPAAASPGPGARLSAAGLKRVVDIVCDGCGAALLSVDVSSSEDGTSFVGVNSIPAGCALFNQITERIRWSLAKSGLPALGRYYLAELDDSSIMFVAPSGRVQLSVIVDGTKVQLGLLLNVILPEALAALEEAGAR